MSIILRPPVALKKQKKQNIKTQIHPTKNEADNKGSSWRCFWAQDNVARCGAQGNSYGTSMLPALPEIIQSTTPSVIPRKNTWWPRDSLEAHHRTNTRSRLTSRSYWLIARRKFEKKKKIQPWDRKNNPKLIFARLVFRLWRRIYTRYTRIYQVCLYVMYRVRTHCILDERLGLSPKHFSRLTALRCDGGEACITLFIT